jgi:hypothetical protein
MAHSGEYCIAMLRQPRKSSERAARCCCHPAYWHFFPGSVSRTDAAAAAQELGKGGTLLLPPGILALLPGQRIQDMRFDFVNECDGLAVRRNQIVPAARDHLRGLKTEDAIGERVAAVMIEEKPAIEAFGAEGLLNLGRAHGNRLPREAGTRLRDKLRDSHAA